MRRQQQEQQQQQQHSTSFQLFFFSFSVLSSLLLFCFLNIQLIESYQYNKLFQNVAIVIDHHHQQQSKRRTQPRNQHNIWQRNHHHHNVKVTWSLLYGSSSSNNCNKRLNDCCLNQVDTQLRTVTINEQHTTKRIDNFHNHNHQTQTHVVVSTTQPHLCSTLFNNDDNNNNNNNKNIVHDYEKNLNDKSNKNIPPPLLIDTFYHHQQQQKQQQQSQQSRRTMLLRTTSSIGLFVSSIFNVGGNNPIPVAFAYTPDSNPLRESLYLISRAQEATVQQERFASSGSSVTIKKKMKRSLKLVEKSYRLLDQINFSSQYVTPQDALFIATQAGYEAVEALNNAIEYTKTSFGDENTPLSREQRTYMIEQMMITREKLFIFVHYMPVDILQQARERIEQENKDNLTEFDGPDDAGIYNPVILPWKKIKTI